MEIYVIENYRVFHFNIACDLTVLLFSKKKERKKAETLLDG
jgi:hypothetical protein